MKDPIVILLAGFGVAIVFGLASEGVAALGHAQIADTLDVIARCGAFVALAYVCLWFLAWITGNDWHKA